jgi:hypothetical protein
MKKIYKWSLFLFILFVSLIFLSPTPKKSIGGRIIRFSLGSALAEQDIEDLVADICHDNRPQELKLWADTILSKYKSGTLHLDPSPQYWSPGSVAVSYSEAPLWMQRFWGESELTKPPHVSIRLNDDGTPSFVIYGWYLKGVAIAATPTDQINFGWRHTEASPGIYAYAIEK